MRAKSINPCLMHEFNAHHRSTFSFISLSKNLEKDAVSHCFSYSLTTHITQTICFFTCMDKSMDAITPFPGSQGNQTMPGPTESILDHHIAIHLLFALHLYPLCSLFIQTNQRIQLICKIKQEPSHEK